MDNTNFQTIHQMGNAINNVVRQAMGRDNVQNIDMDYVTVAQRKRAIENTATGNPATFETDAITPMKLLIPLAPIQDLHGYDYPWPEGGGKNLAMLIPTLESGNGITLTKNSDGSLHLEGTATSTYSGYINQQNYNNNQTPILPAGTYTVSCEGFPTDLTATTRLTLTAKYSDNTSIIESGTTFAKGNGTGEPLTFTAEFPFKFNCWLNVVSGSVINFDLKVQLESGDSATSYVPYSNICPISGWTGVNVTVSPTLNEQDGTTYSIVFPTSAGTVYSGTLTVNEDGTGTLIVTDANIASYNGETLPSTWISDRDVYAQGTSPTTGAQVVYKLATPVTYNLTELEVIETLLGTNNVWSDTGDITVMYKNYEEVI